MKQPTRFRLAALSSLEQYKTPWGRCRKLFTLAGVLHLMFLFGCEAPPPFVPFPAGITPPRSVAVMPLDNQTSSDSGALFLRKQMHKNLKKKGYISTRLSEVDQLLSDQFGILAGGEVTRDRIAPIGKALGVDAVITGTVLKFGNKNRSIITEEEVEATFSLHETQTGNILWEYHGYASRGASLFPLSPESLGYALAESMLGAPRQRLVYEFYEKLLTEMPNGAESQYEGRK